MNGSVVTNGHGDEILEGQGEKERETDAAKRRGGRSSMECVGGCDTAVTRIIDGKSCDCNLGQLSCHQGYIARQKLLFADRMGQ